MSHTDSVSGKWLAAALILFVLYVLLWGTFGGVRRALRNGDRRWVTGILVAWVLGVGWLAGWIYMATHRPIAAQKSVRRPLANTSGQSVRKNAAEDARQGVTATKNVGSEIVSQARRGRLPYGQVHAATQVEALVRKATLPSPQAWFYARDPEHLVVMFAPDLLRRFSGASWWADLKVAPGDGFGGDLGAISSIKIGGVVYSGVEPQSEAKRFVDRLRLHHLPGLASAPEPTAAPPEPTSTEDENTPEVRLARLRELLERGLITEAQLDERTREILREI